MNFTFMTTLYIMSLSNLYMLYHFSELCFTFPNVLLYNKLASKVHRNMVALIFEKNMSTQTNIYIVSEQKIIECISKTHSLTTCTCNTSQ